MAYSFVRCLITVFAVTLLGLLSPQVLAGSDGDGYDDQTETKMGTDPRDPAHYPFSGDALAWQLFLTTQVVIVSFTRS